MSVELETRNLHKEFMTPSGYTLPILRDISIKVGAGELVAIVGASGSGKTTFLKILDGLLQPTRGEVLLAGKPVKGPGADRGFVFQAESLYPWRTVLKNVLLGFEIQGKGKKESRDTASHFIRLVGLSGFEHYYPYQLSGGMRQRVNLARAMAVNPEVLLMDEPFASLDAQTREIMQSELLSIWNRHRKTVVFVTHQIDEAVYLADKVIIFTARPGSVKAIVDIDLPRPRPLEVKRTTEFIAYTDKIWKMIEDEVREGMGLTGSQPK